MIRNDINSYGSAQKFLHWLMALLIFGLFAVGLYMSDLDLTPQKLQLYQWHKSIGITILALVFVRLIWRASNVHPKIPGSKWEVLAAETVHYALYILMIITPLCGWLMSSYAGYPVSVFHLFTLPDLVQPDKEKFEIMRDRHSLLAWTLVFLACAHAGAALFHHFIKKDNVLRRMTWGGKKI